MALKDWMQVLPNPNSNRYLIVFDSRKTSERLFIKKENIVSIDGRKPKTFKTKSKALAYAKAYMRKH